jgi:uncharacterized membrane protein YbhN (UPF0104 family)
MSRTAHHTDKLGDTAARRGLRQPPRSARSGGGSAQRRQLRSGLVSAAVLSLLVGGLVLAIPGLGAVGHRVGHARWGWIALGGVLELASCLGYVVAFQRIFRELPGRFGMLVAAAEQAFGAVVPVGGAGGIAAGGWLLSRAGMPIRTIADRSAVLFLFTSATNVATLVLAGAGLAVGLLAGPSDLALSALPAGVGLAVLVLFLVLARRVRSEAGERRSSLGSRILRATAGASADTLQALRRPDWRLVGGAMAFLFCDIAVLWMAVHSLGYDVPVAPLLLAYLIGYLANALPIPGGVGVLDGGLAGALILYHVPAPVALGGVLVYHSLALWIPAVSGTMGFVAAQRQISSAGVRLVGADGDAPPVAADADALPVAADGDAPPVGADPEPPAVGADARGPLRGQCQAWVTPTQGGAACRAAA